MRSWYKFSNAGGDASVTELYIYDEIGASFFNDTAVTAKQFLADLNALPTATKTIRVHINSPGGDVFDAITIANALRVQRVEKGRTVETIVDGLAASAASIIICAGQPARISDNGVVMVHEPFMLEVGNAAAMRKAAEALDTIRDSIVQTYQWISPLSDAQLRDLMAQETWMDADEAIANGFATEKIAGASSKVAASVGADVLARLHVPDRFRDRIVAATQPPAPAPKPPTPARPPATADAAAVLAAVESAGLSATFARELVLAALPLDQVTARIERAKDIRKLCALAKLPELADALMSSTGSLDAVRLALTTITARLDAVEIDNHFVPGEGQPHTVRSGARMPSIYDIYKERNRRHYPDGTR